MSETNAVPLKRARELLYKSLYEMVIRGFATIGEADGELVVYLQKEEDRRLLRGIITEGNTFFGWPVTIRVVGKITIGGEE
jgi:protein involved in ribonucleotide reduction